MYKIYIIYSCCKTSVLKVVFEEKKNLSLMFPSDTLFFLLPTFERGNGATIPTGGVAPATHLPKHG